MTMRAVATVALMLACVGPALAAGNVVTIEKGGHLLLNGKRFFPLGLYSKPKGADPYREMAEAGFNLVRAAADPADLNAAAEAGLYCWIPLGGTLDLSKDAEAREAQIRKIVAGAKDHPALLMWESRDEPAWTWKDPATPPVLPENLAMGYRLVKQLDPNHPVTLNHAPRNTVATLRKYNAACDAVSVDIYPVVPPDILHIYAITADRHHGDLRNQTISCVGEYVDKMRQVAGPDRPVWMVLQGFAWAALDAQASVKSSIAYPSYEQTRYMAWQSVIHGCNGIIYWGTHTLQEQSECWTGIKKVVRELADLNDVLVANPAPVELKKEYEELGFSIDAGVETSVRDAGAFRYVLAANSSGDPAAVAFSGLDGVPDGDLEALGEGRTVALKGGAFRDEFAGFAVHIYRAPKNP
jgi:hypothetical protein